MKKILTFLQSDKGYKVAIMMLIMSTISLIYLTKYALTIPKRTVNLNEIIREKQTPDILNFEDYSLKDYDVHFIDMKETENNNHINGFYYYDFDFEKGQIFINDLENSDIKSTFLHEYSHHLMNTNMDKTPYLESLDKKEIEVVTDLLSVKLSESKNIDFKPNYAMKITLKYKYNKNKELKKDINTLIDIENNKITNIVMKTP